LAKVAKPCQRQFSKAYPLVTHTHTNTRTHTRSAKCNSFPLSAFLIFITICLIFAFSYGSYFALPHSPHKSLSLFRHLSALRAFFIGSVAGSDRAKLSFFPIHHQLGIYTENK